jgi:hypothetical protein
MIHSFRWKKSLFCTSLPSEEEVVGIFSRKKTASHFYFSPDECSVPTQSKRAQVSVRHNARCVLFSVTEPFFYFAIPSTDSVKPHSLRRFKCTEKIEARNQWLNNCLLSIVLLNLYSLT